MLKALALLLTLLITTAPAPAASRVKARTLSGIGVLLLRSDQVKQPILTLFKEPSLGRITGIAAAQLPALTPSVSPPAGFTAAIVTAKKTGWYRIIYDDGEREGWLEKRPSYQFYSWKELLINRPVELIGGLRKEFYLLRIAPDNSADALETLAKGSSITPVNLDGDWARVRTASQTQGWLRWRDDNGRLVIALGF